MNLHRRSKLWKQFLVLGVVRPASKIINYGSTSRSDTIICETAGVGGNSHFPLWRFFGSSWFSRTTVRLTAWSQRISNVPSCPRCPKSVWSENNLSWF
jgi:hypothetical protein